MGSFRTRDQTHVPALAGGFLILLNYWTTKEIQLPFIILPNLFTSVWIHGYSSHSIGYNPLLSLFFSCSYFPRLGHEEFLHVDSPVLSIHFHDFSALLFSDTTKCFGSSCIFPALVLKLVISVRNPGSFYWRIDLSIMCASGYWLLNFIKIKLFCFAKDTVKKIKSHRLGENISQRLKCLLSGPAQEKFANSCWELAGSGGLS